MREWRRAAEGTAAGGWRCICPPPCPPPSSAKTAAAMTAEALTGRREGGLRRQSRLNHHGLLQQRAHGVAGLGAHCAPRWEESEPASGREEAARARGAGEWGKQRREGRRLVVVPGSAPVLHHSMPHSHTH